MRQKHIAIDDGGNPPALPARRRGFPWARRAIVFITCVLAANALVGERGLGETLRARRQYEGSAADLAALRAENARLRETIYHLHHDVRTIEDLARGELGLIRPGEILFFVKDVPVRP